MDVYGAGKGGQYEAFSPRRSIPIGSTDHLKFAVRDFIDGSKLNLGIALNKRPSPFAMPKAENATAPGENAPTTIPVRSDILEGEVNDDEETKPALRDRSEEKD